MEIPTDFLITHFDYPAAMNRSRDLMIPAPKILLLLSPAFVRVFHGSSNALLETNDSVQVTILDDPLLLLCFFSIGLLVALSLQRVYYATIQIVSR